MTNATERFLDAARQHGIKMVEGDSNATNLAYDSLMEALRELRENPDKGVGFLYTCLLEDDLSIVGWAALFLLPFDEGAASQALSRVVQARVPRLSLSASITLREWQAGRLKVE